jgi:hypothetical protein
LVAIVIAGTVIGATATGAVGVGETTAGAVLVVVTVGAFVERTFVAETIVFVFGNGIGGKILGMTNCHRNSSANEATKTMIVFRSMKSRAPWPRFEIIAPNLSVPNAG